MSEKEPPQIENLKLQTRKWKYITHIQKKKIQRIFFGVRHGIPCGNPWVHC